MTAALGMRSGLSEEKVIFMKRDGAHAGVAQPGQRRKVQVLIS